MSNLLFYIISTGVCLGLFVSAYQLFLRNNTRFNLCRTYLIAAILLSFLIPSLPIDLGIKPLFTKETVKTVQPRIDLSEQTQVESIEAEPILTTDKSWNIDPIQTIVYALIAISLLLLVRFAYRFGSIILIQISGNRLENEDGVNLIFTDKTDNAFSFLGNIFINPLKFNDEEKRLIIEHEREHIRHFHSVDLIIVELLIVFQWFNPFAYIARRKLIEIHEFIADNGVIKKGADPYSYQNLLLSVVTSSCLPNAGNQLSAFITKKRIAMIGKPMNQTGKRVNFLILIPVAAILVLGVSAFSPIENRINKNELSPINLSDTVKNKNEVFTVVEQMPTFGKGTIGEFDLWVEETKNYPKTLLYTGIQGTVYVQFIVERDGKVANPKIIRGVHSDLDKEALSVISQSPNWNPGKQRGQNVRVSLTQPVTFFLIGSPKKSDAQVPKMPKIDTLKDKIVKEKSLESAEEEVFIVVEQMPTFGSGDPNSNEFRAWVATNMQYPKEAAEKGIEGRVFVQFIVSQDGSLKSPKIIRGVDPLLDAEALRVVGLSPKWNPGMQRGKKVDVFFTFPITFVLDGKEKTKKVQALPKIDTLKRYQLTMRAANEVKDVYLKDFYTELAPNGNQNYSVILKKECSYAFNLFTGNPDDKISFILGIRNEGETLTEIIGEYRDGSKIKVTPKKTGAYNISLSNLTSKSTSVLLYLSFTGMVSSEPIPTNPPNSEITIDIDNETFMVVEQMPTFGSGDPNEFRAFIAANLQYPKEAAEKGIQGRVFVQYIIERDGSVTNVKILRGVNPALDKEAIRVVESSPKWNPGMQKGKPVRVSFTSPINFSLQ